MELFPGIGRFCRPQLKIQRFLLPLSTGLERVVEIPILPTKQRNFSICFLSGEQHTPATGVNKCSNPDEGTLNEVSSLANEKFISSRNTYGAKGKAVRVSVGVFSHQNLVYFYTKLEARHCIQVCWATHKINGRTPRKSATGESPGKTDS